MALSDLFSRRRKEPADSETGAPDAPVLPTKVLARFIAGLSARSQPVLLDLGPVVGSNVSFFGEELGCKIVVEDLATDIDRHVRDGTLDAFPAALATRFTLEPSSVDGILCWDLFDYLDKASAQALAAQLARLLRPDGVLMVFFATSEPRSGSRAEYTRHLVVDQHRLQHRPYAAARPKQRPMPNREILRLFEPLRIVDQFLLKSNVRELLLRKPADASAPPAAV